MRNLKYIFSLALVAVLMMSCFNHWTAQQRVEFELQCTQTDTFHHLSLQFVGFDDNEFDSIRVEEYRDTVFIDSFNIFVSQANRPFEKESRVRSATIDRTMNVHHNYIFSIPSQEPYVLANMKMVMWAQYTMFSEGWGCLMGDYTLDGVRFEQHPIPTFIKRAHIWKQVILVPHPRSGRKFHYQLRASPVEQPTFTNPTIGHLNCASPHTSAINVQSPPDTIV